MSDQSDAQKAALREELRVRANRLLDKHGTMIGSYGRPTRPHVMVKIEGVEIHRDDFGMYVYVADQPIYTEVRNEQCTNCDHIRAVDVVSKLRKLTILDDLADRG